MREITIKCEYTGADNQIGVKWLNDSTLTLVAELLEPGETLMQELTVTERHIKLLKKDNNIVEHVAKTNMYTCDTYLVSILHSGNEREAYFLYNTYPSADKKQIADGIISAFLNRTIALLRTAVVTQSPEPLTDVSMIVDFNAVMREVRKK